MMPLYRLLLILGLVLGTTAARAETPTKPDPVPDALQRYVAREDKTYAWSVASEQEIAQTRIRTLELKSQTWQGIEWKHPLVVFEPAKVVYPRQMLLFVTGGDTGQSPREGELAMGIFLARLCGARVALLLHVPNQPLLGDHVEDDLITETWLKYLETGDESWPLLFPMVKSAVRAMDALQEYTARDGGTRAEQFVITGASKRGWTSWLTPLADKRVVATAPIVIDMLNFRAQMRHQLELVGRFSEQIDDYTRKGLVKRPGERESGREARLREMMDPWTYRQSLALPKLLVVGTNDPYWAVDAMTIYIDDLVGPKYVLAEPNVGHNLGDRKESAMKTIAVFFRAAVSNRPLPQITWTRGADGGRLELDVTSDAPPRAARAWSAASSDNDFRKSKWTSTPLEFADGRGRASARPEGTGRVALFAELEFRLDDITYSLTTPVFRQ